MSRIINYAEATSPASDDYLVMDGSAEGTRKIKPSKIGATLDPTLSESDKAAPADIVGEYMTVLNGALDLDRFRFSAYSYDKNVTHIIGSKDFYKGRNYSLKYLIPFSVNYTIYVYLTDENNNQLTAVHLIAPGETFVSFSYTCNENITAYFRFRITVDHEAISVTVTGSSDHHNKIDEVSSGIDTLLTEVPLQNSGAKFVNLSGNVISLQNGEPVLQDASSVFYVRYASCAPGDVFLVNGTGGSAARLYAFVENFDSDATSANIIKKADPASSIYESYITAPENAYYVVFNFVNSTDYAYKLGNSIKDYISDCNLAIQALDDKISNLIDTENIVLEKNKAVNFSYYSGNYRPRVSNGVIAADNANGWETQIVECNPGDEFIVTGVGGSGNYRLYAFCEEVKNNISIAIDIANPETSTAGFTSERLVAPLKAKYAVFNFKTVSEHSLLKIENGAISYLANEVESVVDDQNKTKHIRFMVFGNSYGMDSVTYVPFILKNLGITSEVYLYRRDACSLRDIYNRWESDSQTDHETDGIHTGTYGRTVYHIDTRVDSSWKVNTRISMKNCVELGNWDFITLQQWSAYSIDESTYSPWLSLVIDKIRQSIDKSTLLAWTQVCTRSTHDDKQASLSTFKNVSEKYPFDFFIPYGTAVFNARENDSLAALGDYSSHNFWKDGVHLQDGLPRYIASLTICEAICRKFFPKTSVMYDKTRPYDDIISSWGNGMPMTPSVGVTEENCLLAQYSAINACNNMFKITPTESLPFENYISIEAFPSEGQTGVLYRDDTTGYTYTWDGSSYVLNEALN